MIQLWPFHQEPLVTEELQVFTAFDFSLIKIFWGRTGQCILGIQSPFLLIYFPCFSDLTTDISLSSILACSSIFPQHQLEIKSQIELLPAYDIYIFRARHPNTNGNLGALSRHNCHIIDEYWLKTQNHLLLLRGCDDNKHHEITDDTSILDLH